MTTVALEIKNKPSGSQKSTICTVLFMLLQGPTGFYGADFVVLVNISKTVRSQLKKSAATIINHNTKSTVFLLWDCRLLGRGDA